MKGALTTKKPVTFGNDYEFFLFDSLQAMIRRLKQKEKEYKLCRLVAGFGWQWISNRDKKAHDIKLEGLKLRWNSRPQDWIHSEEARSMKEAGSIHTTQGYDLNYAGVIFGKEISYDEDAHRIVIKKDHYHDKYGKFGANDGQLKKFITNIYKILMYRGVRGTYVYVCDEKLRNYFRQHILPFNAGVGTKIVPLHEKDNYFNDVPLDLSAESEDEDATKKSPGDGK
jgi:hypothetical protein